MSDRTELYAPADHADAPVAEPQPADGDNLGDYSNSRVPEHFRNWSASSIFGVMMGVATAMIFLSWGGVLVRSFGTMPLFIGMIISTVLITVPAIVFARRASQSGLGAELLTRSSGFGYFGSIPASLIYGFAMLMYFAFEGGIMVNAVSSFFDSVPRTAIILMGALIFIPLCIYGMKVMNIVMWVTLPIYVIFMIITIVIAANQPVDVGFWSYMPETVDTAAGPPIVQIVAASLGFATQIALAADTGRFIKRDKQVTGSIVVGGLPQVIVFMGLAMLGAWLALQFDEADPGVYLPVVMGIWGVLFVIVTQLRINVVNVYASSIALTNAGKRLSAKAPGRPFWVVLVIALGTIAMLTDLYSQITAVMTFAAVFLLAWVLTVFADLFIVRKLLRWIPEEDAPYERHELPLYNPIGLVSVGGALIISVPLALGVGGPLGVTLAPFAAGLIPLVLVPTVSWVRRRRRQSLEASK